MSNDNSQHPNLTGKSEEEIRQAADRWFALQYSNTTRIMLVRRCVDKAIDLDLMVHFSSRVPEETNDLIKSGHDKAFKRLTEVADLLRAKRIEDIIEKEYSPQ